MARNRNFDRNISGISNLDQGYGTTLDGLHLPISKATQGLYCPMYQLCSHRFLSYRASLSLRLHLECCKQECSIPPTSFAARMEERETTFDLSELMAASLLDSATRQKTELLPFKISAIGLDTTPLLLVTCQQSSTPPTKPLAQP